jgi:hypothetical protein
MKTFITEDISELMGTVHYRPAVSIIMPFEPKMNLKVNLSQALNFAADKVERELKENYPPETVMLIMQKLKKLLKELNFNTFKKSIAIFVSPVFEKVLYLDLPVEEKIIIDESFEIRDLVYCKKQAQKYLVLQLSTKEIRMYLGENGSFIKIVSEPALAQAGNNLKDSPERVANFSDTQQYRETLMNNLLLHVDHTLEQILQSYQLPLFIMGSERILGHFKKITKHTSVVVETITGNYEEKTIPELKEILQPYVADWKKVFQKDLLNKLDHAAGMHQLSTGMQEVWRNAMAQKGKLLVVEKNFQYAAVQGDKEENIEKAIEPFSKFSYIRDAVDDVIEKVLQNGGDVEFVEENMLKDFGQIALIHYY